MADETPTPTPEKTPTPSPEKGGQTVPYERFAQKISEIKALENQVLDAQKQAESAKGWEAKHADLSTSIETERAAWAQQEALFKAGVRDPDVSELA